MREAGLEPARPEWTLEPESSESANSTTRAFIMLDNNSILGDKCQYTPKHSKRYAELGKIIRAAFAEYAAEVKNGEFPGRENSF